MSTQTDRLNALERTYCFFAKGFDYPDPEFWNNIEGRPLCELAVAVNDAGIPEDVGEKSFPVRDQQSREVEFVSTFEQGTLQQYEGSCCPRVGRDGILEEVLRFYHHFGLRLSNSRRDFPDNFVTELEFMGHLVRLERDAINKGDNYEPILRAQYDFLDRHVALWAEELPKRLERMEIDNSFNMLAWWLIGFVRAHIEHLNATFKSSDGAPADAAAANAATEAVGGQ